MATSRASPASEGEVSDTQRKANSHNQNNDSEINGSDRLFGLDGASDNHNYRPLSRSPSPFRNKRSRSPSPYHSRRAPDRSPSSYRHSARADRGHDSNASRSYHKRKMSPPRGSRPEKRHYTDRSRDDRRPKSYVEYDRTAPPRLGGRNERKDVPERPYAEPMSYDGLENPTAVPDFRAGLPTNGQFQKSQNGNRQHETPRQERPPQGVAVPNGARERAPQPSAREDVDMKSTPDEVEYTIAPVEEKVPTEESREQKRRRWALMRADAEKASLRKQAALTNAASVSTPNVASPAMYAESSISPFASPRNGDLDSAPASPDVMVVDKQVGFSEANSPAADSPAAADYDPMQDMLDDQIRAAQKYQNAEVSSEAYRETDPKALSTLPAEKAVPVKKQKKELDMFASDDEDEEGDAVDDENVGVKGTVLDEKLLDNWDDPEGYYKLISNELVNNGRYRVIRKVGSGVFANVAQAEDTTVGTEDPSRKLVAIKMIRRNELMRKASQKEMDFLRKVNEADPQDKRHIIRLLGSFDHKGHLCIVFEHMSKNLRDLLKEETNGHGLSLQAVSAYAKQMFEGLQHLQNCQVIHLDLKPDNVLVSADKKTIKLADFGTAVDKRDIIERTEYLVSRFYRAPEIILGFDISYPVDVWAVGCTIFELWTGKILFTGSSNNQMLKAFMECLGWPSEKLLRKGRANNVLAHFEYGSALKFISREIDKDKKPVIRKIERERKIKDDLKARVLKAAHSIVTGKPTAIELNDLVDLLNACLHMNVEKRVTPQDAVKHPFFTRNKLVPKLVPKPAVVKPTMMKRGTPTLRR